MSKKHALRLLGKEVEIKLQAEILKTCLKKFGENHFVGYEKAECESKILALLDEDFKEVSTLKDAGWVMLENTPFYATSGGQSADSGFIAKREVLDTQKFFNLNLSFVKAGEELKVGDIVHARIDTEKREQIARHHSATHLLHHALREILGSHVSQAGSLVESNKLRFDFTHHKALSKEELESIEKRVNEMIINSSEAILENMPLEEAKKSGAIALFNEKYQGNVRVLTLGESKELCGGTHVKNTAQIGSFYIVKESGVSAGVRRIEAVVSKAALEFVKNQLEELSKVKDELKNNDILNGVKKLKNEILSLKNELKNSSKTELDSKNIQGVEICVKRIDNGDIKAMIDDFKNKFAKAVILLIQVKDEKITLAAGVKDAPLKAGALVKEAAQILGGNGGGRDDFATAGGKDLSKINEALKQSLETIEKAL